MTEIEMAPENIERTSIQEDIPFCPNIRIVYSTNRVTDSNDPILHKIYGMCSKVIAAQDFKHQDGSIGTAFFCVFPKDWVAPTAEQSEENLKKLEKSPQT